VIGVNRDSWDIEWAAERAAAATKYLAAHYPECAGAPELHPDQEAAHEAAVVGDREAYLEALRGYMRAGRKVALAIRKGAA
jgi:hypothetical protein